MVQKLGRQLCHTYVAHGAADRQPLQLIDVQADVAPQDGGPHRHRYTVVITVLPALLEAKKSRNCLLVAKNAFDQWINCLLNRVDVTVVAAADRVENPVQGFGRVLEGNPGTLELLVELERLTGIYRSRFGSQSEGAWAPLVFCIDIYVLDVVGDIEYFTGVANHETLQGKRGLQPGAIELGNEHAGLEAHSRDFDQSHSLLHTRFSGFYPMHDTPVSHCGIAKKVKKSGRLRLFCEFNHNKSVVIEQPRPHSPVCDCQRLLRPRIAHRCESRRHLPACRS